MNPRLCFFDPSSKSICIDSLTLLRTIRPSSPITTTLRLVHAWPAVPAALCLLTALFRYWLPQWNAQSAGSVLLVHPMCEQNRLGCLEAAVGSTTASSSLCILGVYQRVLPLPKPQKPLTLAAFKKFPAVGALRVGLQSYQLVPSPHEHFALFTTLSFNKRVQIPRIYTS